jgi:ribosome-binding protein aMBF1 (putative translation factor)
MGLQAGSIFIHTNQDRVAAQRHRLAGMSTAERTQELNDAEAMIQALQSGKVNPDKIQQATIDAAETLNAVGIVRIP